MNGMMTTTPRGTVLSTFSPFSTATNSKLDEFLSPQWTDEEHKNLAPIDYDDANEQNAMPGLETLIDEEVFWTLLLVCLFLPRSAFCELRGAMRARARAECCMVIIIA